MRDWGYMSRVVPVSMLLYAIMVVIYVILVSLPHRTAYSHPSPRACSQPLGAGGCESPRACAPGHDWTAVPYSPMYVTSPLPRVTLFVCGCVRIWSWPDGWCRLYWCNNVRRDLYMCVYVRASDLVCVYVYVCAIGVHV